MGGWDRQGSARPWPITRMGGRIPRAVHRPPRWSWSAQRGCGGKLLQHVNSDMVRRGSYQGCKVYLKLFLGRRLESAKPLKFLWKAFPELSDASGRQPRGTKERPGTPPVCFKGSHGQPKRAQNRPSCSRDAQRKLPKCSLQCIFSTLCIRMAFQTVFLRVCCDFSQSGPLR